MAASVSWWCSLWKINLISFLFFAILIPSNVYSAETQVGRTLTNTIYCNDTDNHNLVYVRAESMADVLHYLWSSIDSFTVLTVLTDVSSELKVNCKALLSDQPAGSIYFTNGTTYSFALIFDTLWEYNDTSDKADFSSSDTKYAHLFQKLKWDKVTVIGDDQQVEAKFKVSNLPNSTNGTDPIQLTVGMYGYNGRSKLLPHLVHTPNSAELDFVLDSMPVLYKNSRFAVEVYFVGLEPNSSSFSQTLTRSLDDEYTPGVFTLNQIKSYTDNNTIPAGFVQWKPTCYTSASHSRESSTVVADYGISTPSLPSDFQKSIAYAFYGNSFNVFVQSMNVSFGLKEDGFFANTNYASWTLSSGYGIAPQDAISTLVVIVILVGFGIPALFIMLGGVYVGVKRYRMKTDDLLLGQT